MTIPIPPGEDIPPGTLPGPDPREFPPTPAPLPGPDPTTNPPVPPGPPIRPGGPDTRPPSSSDSEHPEMDTLAEIRPDPGNKAGIRDTAGDRLDHA